MDLIGSTTDEMDSTKTEASAVISEEGQGDASQSPPITKENVNPSSVEVEDKLDPCTVVKEDAGSCDEHSESETNGEAGKGNYDSNGIHPYLDAIMKCPTN